MRGFVLPVAVILANLASFGLFAASLLIMTTDAQGVFVFILSLPLIVILGALALGLSRKLKSEAPLFLRGTQIHFGALVLFCVMSFIPGVNAVPRAGMDALLWGFSQATGKSPRQYFRDRNDLQKLILDQIQATGGGTIDFSPIRTANNWDRLCVFPPYTSDEVASAAVGAPFDLSTYAEIASSDSIHVLALFKGKSLVNYAKVSRSRIDFEVAEAVCVERSRALMTKRARGYGF